MTDLGLAIRRASGALPRRDKPFLSFSQVATFLRCPRQYQYRYVRGIRTPATGAMVQSRAFHEAAALNYRQKVSSGEDLPMSEMQEFFVERFERMLARGDAALAPHEKAGLLKDQGVAVTAAHHRFIAPGVEPLLVEHRFRIDLGEDVPFDLVGVWDLVERDGTVADNKAYRKAPRQDMVDRDLQLGVYALAFCTITGEAECPLRMDAVVKDASPWTRQLRTLRTRRDCLWLKGLLGEVGRAIQAGRFYPNPNGWHCDPNFCGYWTRCMGMEEVTS